MAHRCLFALVGMLVPGSMIAAPSLYVAGDSPNTLVQYTLDGTYLGTVIDLPDTEGGGLLGVTPGPGDSIYVSQCYAGRIWRYDVGTATPGILTSLPLGIQPAGIAINGPNLYVVDHLGGTGLHRLDANTGAYIGTVSALPGTPVGVTTDSAGNIYASTRHGPVYKFDGSMLTTLVPDANAESCAVMPDGYLYVGNWDRVTPYKLDGTPWGAGGNMLDPTFTSGHSMSYVTGLAWSPDGNLCVADWAQNSIFRFSGTTGAYIDTLVPSSPEIVQPWGMAFSLVPEPAGLVVVLPAAALLFRRRRRQHQ